MNTRLAAELYGNMTRYPPSKVHPKVAAATIRSLTKIFTVIDLNMEDYLAAIDRCAERNLISGVIFDALHFQAALKAEGTILYTANTKDFERLVDEHTPFSIQGIPE